jgi:hypothetical protein
MKTFIRTEFLKDITICDRLIDYYKNSNEKTLGKILGKDGKPIVDATKKSSTDVYLNDSPIAHKYCNELQNILNNYIKEYSFSNQVAIFGLKERINIQHYKAGQAYYEWHCERDSNIGYAASRHLVFTTYLNDVQDGGETEFYYQELKIKPQKGLTVIFPSDWTHTHKGITSNTEDKYIVTGWFNYLQQE